MREIAKHRASRPGDDMRTRIRDLRSPTGARVERRRSLQLSLEVVGLVAIIGFAFPATGLASKADRSLTITVLVYNHAQASAAILAGAEREAGKILGEAGVGAVWLDCLDRHSATDPQGLCSKAREPADVVLRVLPGRIPNRFQDTLFGITFLPTLASVYYEYAVRLAKSDNEVPTLLGCAIAHEVGHLLLGPNSHSGGGIMHGEWGPKEFRLALMGGLLFTSQQSKVIQAEARRRISLQTGILKEQRRTTVDQRAEPRVIPQNEGQSDNSKPTFSSPVERILEHHPGHSLNVREKVDLHSWQDFRKAGALFFKSDQSQQMRATLLLSRRAEEPSPTITVLVFNYTDASPATIAGAEREAGRIFGGAGLRVVWLGCPMPTGNLQGPCQTPLKATELMLRIDRAPARNTLQDNVFGFAAHPAVATVYYEYAVRQATSDDAKFEAPMILGCVIAHEIGHLLLGSNSHSRAGIMQPDWERKQLRQLMTRTLLFTTEQSQLMRAQAQARMGFQPTNPDPGLIPQSY
jgi:hypothetical protein